MKLIERNGFAIAIRPYTHFSLSLFFLSFRFFFSLFLFLLLSPCLFHVDTPISLTFLRLHQYNACFLCSRLALGAAYGTAKSGTGIAAMSVMRPELIMKSIIPVVMAGIIAIYGLVVSVLIAQGLGSPSTYSLFK